MIEFKSVWKTFNNNHGVKDISFSVQPGEFLVFLGSSGCGKTTTLKLINRLLEPTQGVIRFEDQIISDLDPILLRRSMGYVFQDVGLFPHLNVEENITLLLRILGTSKKQRLQRVESLLKLVNLKAEDFRHRTVTSLSGGQLQRVGIARALAHNPKVLLMDEPFSALDFITRHTLQQEFLQLNGQLQKTILFVTHDLREALYLGDRLVIMHQGSIEQIGTPTEILQHPATPFVQKLWDNYRAPFYRIKDHDEQPLV